MPDQSLGACSSQNLSGIKPPFLMVILYLQLPHYANKNVKVKFYNTFAIYYLYEGWTYCYLFLQPVMGFSRNFKANLHGTTVYIFMTVNLMNVMHSRMPFCNQHPLIFLLLNLFCKLRTYPSPKQELIVQLSELQWDNSNYWAIRISMAEQKLRLVLVRTQVIIWRLSDLTIHVTCTNQSVLYII